MDLKKQFKKLGRGKIKKVAVRVANDKFYNSFSWFRGDE